jgi:hypothetical protein
LEEAEAKYIETLRKVRPDLAEQVHYLQEKESRPPRKEWRPKSAKADKKLSADAHMVFILPAEFHAQTQEELSVAQLDLGPRPVIFEKPQAKNYKHLKALYLKGFINGQPVNKMLVDTGAAVNIMPYSVLRRLGRSTGDLIKTNVMLSDFNGQTSEAQGSSVWISLLETRPSRRRSSSSTVKAPTMFYLAETGFTPIVAFPP